MDVFTGAFRLLEGYAERHREALVAYSGGKESLAALDMAVRVFRRVVCFHYYFVPGLQVVERQLRFAMERYKVEVLLYPGPLLVETLKAGQFCDETFTSDEMPSWSRDDITALARADAGIPLVITGSKYGDGLGQGLKNRRKHEERRRSGRDDEVLPLARWNKWEVLAYLKSRDIPLPESDGRVSSSIDCSTDCLLWLYDKHPEDFRKVCAVFRYAEAVAYRRLWHGVH